MTFALLSISSTCGFVCRSRWIWGLDKMCCLVSWGLELERVLCRNGLPATQCIIPVSASSRLSIWCWSAGKKPGSLFIRPWWLSRPSTMEIRSEKDRKKQRRKATVTGIWNASEMWKRADDKWKWGEFLCCAVLTQAVGRGGGCEVITVRIEKDCELRLDRFWSRITGGRSRRRLRPDKDGLNLNLVPVMWWKLCLNSI